MSYAELIQHLQALPVAQQAQVFDFVEFLASRNRLAGSTSAAADATPVPALPAWLDKPFEVPGFKPMSRDEANART